MSLDSTTAAAPVCAPPRLRSAGLAIALSMALACGSGTLESQGARGAIGSAQSTLVRVDPPAVEITPGGASQFSAAVTGLVEQRVAWSIEESPGGAAITPDGLFAATAPGTYHVVARSIADGSAGQAIVIVRTPAAEAQAPSTPAQAEPAIAGADVASLPMGAFPGCQGAGCRTRGGFAPGSTTYLVTNLNSSGAGSLAACVAASGPRVCLFRVSGTIDGSYAVRNGNLTIDARSAPPGGVQLMATSNASPILDLQASDVVVRGLKIRPTYDSSHPGDPSNKRAIKIYNDSGDVTRMVFDHNSVQFANATPIDLWVHDTSYTPASEITFSWNLVAENFLITGNPAVFSRSFIWGCGSGGSGTSLAVCQAKSSQMTNLDLHHNLIASGGYRNPEFKGASGRLVNNYLYNWGLHAIDLVGTVKADVIGNVFESGPMRGNAQGRGTSTPIELNYRGNSGDDDWAVGQCSGSCYYLAGNVDDLNQPDPDADNWTSGIARGEGLSSSYKRTTRLPAPASGFDIAPEAAASAKAAIVAGRGAGASQRLDCGGAVVAERDSVDARIIAYQASGGGPSVAPVDNSDIQLASISGVTAVCDATTRDNSPAGPEGACACRDSDGDGIPDFWETAFCGSPTGCDPGGNDVAGPWTNLEAYLSGLKPAR